MAQAEAGGALSHLNHEIVASLDDFQDPSQEWRRLFSELLGTFFLVLVVSSVSFSARRLAAQNIGIFGAIGVGAYIALAGLWGSPISGASMNPARTFGPDLVATDFTSYWVYVAGPLVGAVLAVGAAWVLRGAGGGRAGSGAAQGTLFTEVEHPDKG
jgi:glycerol uptake facilitator-like aquaporin